MNPFDLRGPEFLAFYAALSAVVLAWLAMFLRNGEPDGPANGSIVEDPYLIASLRGGKNEVLRVATVSLIDRGLIKVDGKSLETRNEKDIPLVRRPLEKALLNKFLAGNEASSVFDDGGLDTICHTYEDQLTQLGLLPDANTINARTQRRLIAFAILAGVAAIKIWVAIGRGHYNVGFLIVMAIAACLLANAINPRLTKKGSALLADLQNLFASLKDRKTNIKPGGATNEVALLAAVFGLSMIPQDVFPYAKTLYPKAASGSSWYSCSSYACGTTSSCGSSCGGGGCGGGCGGCGG